MDVNVVLPESEIVAFAGRELRAVLGQDFDGRVFLAGGAFKTLLTGRPPRDLDIWGATAESGKASDGAMIIASEGVQMVEAAVPNARRWVVERVYG